MKMNGWRIISLEASDVYKQIKIKGEGIGYELPDKKDLAYFHLFKNIFDYSLDAIELEKAYTKICRKKFAFLDEHNNEYTLAIIDLKFNYTYKSLDDWKTLKELREYFYEHGFNLGGVHYIRYKRSSGSSRQGKCLFIDERMCDYCYGCPYKGKEKVESVRMEKETLLVMLCPGDSEILAGKPLVSKDSRSATIRIEDNLPTGKSLEEYAVAELVKCCPGRDNNGKYKQPEKSAVALCYRYLEEELQNQKFKKVITFSKDAGVIVENIKKRLNLSFEHIKGKHPQNGVSNDELKKYFDN